MENLSTKLRKPSKYRNVKVELDGYIFDSKGEAKRYVELRRLELAGQIHDLTIHPRYPLVIEGVPVKIRSLGFPNGRRVRIELDFEYVDTKTGELISEDYKGKDTDLSRLKRGIFEAIYGRQVRVVKGRG